MIIEDGPETPNRTFPKTRWSMIRQATADHSNEAGGRAMAEFCRNYREPLLAFTRATVAHPQDAEDLVQGFFEKLLTRNFLSSANPERGRLRTFLLTCLKRHIVDEHRHHAAGKRGGGAMVVPIDNAMDIPSQDATPDELFHRQWAMVILSRSLETLRRSWSETGKERLFEALQPWLGFRPENDADRAALAVELGMSKGALKTALYRLRRDYREILLQEVADTLDVKTPNEVQAELKELLVLL
jgi:RNA polymerase sigma-70 factor (ECF subfamily)